MRTILIHAFLLAAFGVLVPWQQGWNFLDATMQAGYAPLGMLLAGPAALRTSRLRAFLYGAGFGLLILCTGYATVNYVTRPEELLLPVRHVLWATLALTLASAAFSVALACWLAARNPATAHGILRGTFFGLLLAGAASTQILPAISPALLTSTSMAKLMAAAAAACLLLGAALGRGIRSRASHSG